MHVNIVEEHPEFAPRDKHSVWIFKLDEEYVLHSPIMGHHFVGEWLRIEPDGKITIPRNYAWNGCSPKFNILDVCILGTPDGNIDVETGKPKTYHASLVHDALYQYYKWHDISRAEIDILFLQMMRERLFKPAKIYYCAVRLFGGFAIGEKHSARAGVEYGVVT